MRKSLTRKREMAKRNVGWFFAAVLFLTVITIGCDDQSVEHDDDAITIEAVDAQGQVLSATQVGSTETISLYDVVKAHHSEKLAYCDLAGSDGFRSSVKKDKKTGEVRCPPMPCQALKSATFDGANASITYDEKAWKDMWAQQQQDAPDISGCYKVRDLRKIYICETAEKCMASQKAPK